MPLKLLLIAAAGGLGALGRFGLTRGVHRLLGVTYPYGTFVVNVLGCGLFGLVFALTDRTFEMREDLQPIVLTGFMGAFTTFSTYAFETQQLVRDGTPGLAVANFLGQNALGMLALLGGMWLGTRA